MTSAYNIPYLYRDLNAAETLFFYSANLRVLSLGVGTVPWAWYDYGQRTFSLASNVPHRSFRSIVLIRSNIKSHFFLPLSYSPRPSVTCWGQ
jgi:hypothetical protein